jgi:hypothetical protein
VAYVGTTLLAGVLIPWDGSDALMLVPALVAFWPLLCGRYAGEAHLARWTVQLHGRPQRTQRSAPVVRSPRLCTVRVPRGGRLLGRSLAVRPPPGPVASS